VRPQKSDAGLRNSRAVVPDQTTYLSDSGGRPKVEKNRDLRNEVAPECPPNCLESKSDQNQPYDFHEENVWIKPAEFGLQSR
jgi:hypothetical protein